MTYIERNLKVVGNGTHTARIDLLSDDLYHVTYSTPNAKGYPVCKPTARWDVARDELTRYAVRHNLKELTA